MGTLAGIALHSHLFLLKTVAVRHHAFLNINFSNRDGVQNDTAYHHTKLDRITYPKCIAEIWWFIDVQYVGHHPSWICITCTVDHPRWVVGKVYHCAKVWLELNPAFLLYSSFGFKTPIHANFGQLLDNLDPLNAGLASSAIGWKKTVSAKIVFAANNVFYMICI